MTIGIDASMLVYTGSGVATYTYELIKHLLKQDKKNHYKVFYSSFRKPSRVIEQLNEFDTLGAQVFIYPLPPRILNFLWNVHQWLPVEWFIGKVDWYHSSDFLRPPLLSGTKGITTIHDLTWKIFPEYHTPEIVAGHARKLDKTIKGNDVILVDSENTKKDLLKFYPQIPEESVHKIPLGISNRFKPSTNAKVAVVKKKYSLPNEPFLLYVGAIEPRKRLDLAIKAFSELIKDKKYKDYKFVIAGRAGWKNEDIFQLIKKLQLTKKIIFPGYIEDADLPILYSAAKLFVYLSDYEGFGLPPMEALACGSKVITSNKSSLVEIVPSDFQVDTNNIHHIVDKMKYILHHQFAYHTQYSWKNYADEFLKTLA